MRIEIHPKPDGMQHINFMFHAEDQEPEDLWVLAQLSEFPVPPKRTLQWEREGKEYTVWQYGQCVVGNVMFYIEKHKGVVDKIRAVCRDELERAALPRAAFNELVSHLALELQKAARFMVNGSGELAIDVDEVKVRERVQTKLAEVSEIVENTATMEISPHNI
jgi:hypothetical protein